MKSKDPELKQQNVSLKQSMLAKLQTNQKFLSILLPSVRKNVTFATLNLQLGYYGTSATASMVESSPSGNDFLAETCSAWEAAAKLAEPPTRVVILRTGLVLSKEGGVLGRMVPVFNLFAGKHSIVPKCSQFAFKEVLWEVVNNGCLGFIVKTS